MKGLLTNCKQHNRVTLLDHLEFEPSLILIRVISFQSYSHLLKVYQSCLPLWRKSSILLPATLVDQRIKPLTISRSFVASKPRDRKTGLPSIDLAACCAIANLSGRCTPWNASRIKFTPSYSTSWLPSLYDQFISILTSSLHMCLVYLRNSNLKLIKHESRK